MKHLNTVFTQLKFNTLNYLKLLIIWTCVISLTVFICGYNIISSYPTQSSLDDVYFIMQMPLIYMMFGNFNYDLPNTQVQQFVGETAMICIILVVIMNIILSIKLTRLKEDEKVTDLVLTSKASRLSPTITAYIIVLMVNIIIFILNLILLSSLKLTGSNFNGHLAFCLVLFIIGFFFQNIAFLLSELSSNASNASSLSFLVLGVLFILRMFIDYKYTSLQIISPLSWIGYSKPYVTNNLTPVLIGFIFCIILLCISLYINFIRDIGSGLIREFKGKPKGSKLLNNPYYLRLKLNKNSIIIFIVISIVLGLLFGSLLDSIEQFKDNPIFTSILQGNEKSITTMMKSLVSMICVMVVNLASGLGIKIFYQIKSEQYSNLTDLFYVSNLKRKDIYLSHLLIGFIVSLLIYFVTLFFTYLSLNILGNNNLGINNFLESFINYIPLILFYFTIASIIYLVKPKLISLTYVLITLVFVINTFGIMFFDIPSFVNDVLIIGLLSNSPIEKISYIPWSIVNIISILIIILSILRYQKLSINNLLV